MDSERGQATIDFVALVAVLAALLAGAAATLADGGATAVANAVAGQIRHVLCTVTGAVCRREQQRPCTVASTRDLHRIGVDILLIRVDGERYVLRERLSDGTVRLTVARRRAGGLEVGAGARAELTLKGRRVGVDGDTRGAIQGVVGHGEVFHARDARGADSIMRAIRDGGGPQPHEVFYEGGVRGRGQLGIGGLIAGAQLDGLAETVVGARRDLRSGAVTISLGSGAVGWGLATVVLGGPAGAADGQAALAVTLDRDARPIELALSASGTLTAGTILPAGLARPLGVGGDAAWNTTGRRWELSARLNLSDPAAAAAWATFREAPTSAAAIRALGERLRARAQLDVRTYRVDSSSDGAAAAIALGLGIGGEFEHTVDRSTLLAASARPPGGLWEPRTDCLPA